MKQVIKNYSVEILLVVSALIFSVWLMWHTFSYEDGSMLIATKAWSDFASHIPLIRSFSLGNNFPPEYPIFPGEPIRYHFLFYLLVGLLEKIGLRIDFALNIPSAISFALLTFMIYLLAKLVFKSRAVANISVLLFLFNGSLSFIEFFKAHPLSANTLIDIATNTTFPSFGPYDGKIVSAFWNLNIYTNQRHLALPFALLLFLVYWLFRSEKERTSFSKGILVFGGLFLGLLPFAHFSIFLMAGSVLALLFILLKKQRITVAAILALGGILSLPRILFLKNTASFVPRLEIGYLAPDPLTLGSFTKYWFLNLGLSSLLIPLGFLLAPRFSRKLLVAFLPLFIIGNLVQFSPEIAGNHKFFNVFLSIGNMFVAFVVVLLWRTHLIGKLITVPLVTLLILSGIIDFFPIKNDVFTKLDDYPKNPDVAWIIKNTPKDSVFLNSSYLYNPASLAGRKIFLGWPYFSWSLGYDTDTRFREIAGMYVSSNKHDVCTLRNKKIDFIETQPRYSRKEEFPINFSLFEKDFHLVYKNQTSGLGIYDIKISCNNVY